MTRIWLPIAIIPSIVLCAGLLVSHAQDTDGLRRPPRPPLFADSLSTVSGLSPYPSGCQGQQTGTDYLHAAVEPSVAVDPTNPRHLIGVWQQNRWSNGGADGVMAAVSTDRGVTWTNTFASFSQCSGGTFPRASDPWVTISPDGIAYQIALIVNQAVAPAGVLVSRSSDGGFTWGVPIVLANDTYGDDKETITADPTDSHYVYAVWDWTNVGNTQPAVFSKSADGGVTWTPPRPIYSPGNGGYTIANQIVVLPNGFLVDVFVLSPPRTNTSEIAILQSVDHGDTWSRPYIVSSDEAIGLVDARTQAGIRTGNGIPSSAVDPVTGTIYVTWEDARFSGNQREGVALSKSSDAGITWSTPVQVNQVPDVQAFNPTVAGGVDGAVAITYYDFRQATADTSTLPTNYWRAVSSDGGNTWRETPVAGPFDMMRAALSGKAFFIGDYQALAASGNEFVPFFVATNPAPSLIPSSVFALPRERSGSSATNGHIEINYHPHSIRERLAAKANRLPH